MTVLNGSINDELARYKQPIVKAYNFYLECINDTDDDITDSFFGVEYRNGGIGEIIAGNTIKARTKFNRTFLAEGCIFKAVGSVYFGSERLVFSPYIYAPGECGTDVYFRVHYVSGVKTLSLNSKAAVFP